MPHYILPIDPGAIHDLELVVDRLMHLPEYAIESRDIAANDLLDALLHYWISADFDRLSQLLDDIKFDLPLFRDHLVLEAAQRLANPGRSGYLELSDGILEPKRDCLTLVEMITMDVCFDPTFQTLCFGIFE